MIGTYRRLSNEYRDGTVPAAGFGAVYYTDETDTTMDDAAAAVDQGAALGTVYVAGYQRAGRGRIPGRRWEAAPGSALLLTAISPVDLPPSPPPIAAGVAVAELVGSLITASVALKWPNDIFVNGAKCAGVLCLRRRERLLVGIGINVLPGAVPDETRHPATSLVDQGMPQGNPLSLLAPLLRLLGKWLTDREATRHAEKVLYQRGGFARLEMPDGTTRAGTVCGLAADGALLLREPDGRTNGYVAGELQVTDGDVRGDLLQPTARS